MADDRSPCATTFLIPVYDDWQALELMVRELDEVLPASCRPACLLILDDASPTPPGPGLTEGRFDNISRLVVLRLRRNLGHQRAIAVGLAYVYEEIRAGRVVVMDADGEDRPRDVSRLLERLEANGDSAIVFAERQKRFEPLWFRLFYQLYRQAHEMLTGIEVKVGNFSAIPFRLLGNLVVVSELWSHYAAAVFKSKIPYEAIPTTRGRRLSGASKMSFVGLVTHGLAAISVFGEIVGVRILMLSLFLFGFFALLLAALVSVPASVGLILPGWAIAATVVVLLFMSQTVTLAAGSLFFILYARNQYHFLPLRDYRYYLDEAEP